MIFFVKRMCGNEHAARREQGAEEVRWQHRKQTSALAGGGAGLWGTYLLESQPMKHKTDKNSVTCCGHSAITAFVRQGFPAAQRPFD